MMDIIIYIGIVIATFFFMEFMAWFTHKYVMHGFLWKLHRDHHQPEEGFFEKNDTFFLIYAIPSFLLFLSGAADGFDYKFYIGLGIFLYGLCYFLVHDVFIHQRFKIFRRTDNAYFRAIRKAHKVHHKHLGKKKGECFGMLLVPWQFYREALRSQKKA